MANAIEFVKINKYFPGAHVLKDVSFNVERGEIHALVGENGAGKSTLLNILHGIYSEYEGEVKLFGKTVHFKTPNDAIHNGRISKVHQETNVVRDITVGENVTLGYEPMKGVFVDERETNSRVNEILDRLGCSFRSDEKAFRLSTGEMQMMAIAKALYHDAKIISLDEPTSSLSLKETENLFRVIHELNKEGITILYVSHRLEEIFQLCDRVTVLRDGHMIRTLNVKDTNNAELIRLMVGRDVDSLANRTVLSVAKDKVALRIEDYNGDKFHNASFELHESEILGFFGLVGAGRTELMRALVGMDPKWTGKTYLYEKEINVRNTSQALKNGMGMLPEDRKTEGFINLSTNTDNIAISSLQNYMNGIFLSNKKELINCEKFIKELNINPPRPELLTVNMSGGNQQKVIIAKWLSTTSNILIFDEPTRGIDVGAKVEIYRLIENFVSHGKSIIVVSSDLPEIMGISDRMIVMHEGWITGELKREEFSEERIMTLALGENEHE